MAVVLLGDALAVGAGVLGRARRSGPQKELLVVVESVVESSHLVDCTLLSAITDGAAAAATMHTQGGGDKGGKKHQV